MIGDLQEEIEAGSEKVHSKMSLQKYGRKNFRNSSELG
jgi:hypothetical protein